MSKAQTSEMKRPTSYDYRAPDVESSSLKVDIAQMGALDYTEAGHLRGRRGLCCLLSLSFPFGLFCTISKLLQCDSFKLFRGLQLCHDFGACPYAYKCETITQKRERLHLLHFCRHVPAVRVVGSIPMRGYSYAVAN